jgi:hypothetical protein
MKRMMQSASPCISGIDPRTFSGISLLLTALRLLETHVNGK